MDGAGPSIGNYKGVMLCNRPFQGVSAAAKQSYNAAKSKQTPFLSTCGNNDPVGLNPIRHPPNVVVNRSKKDTALSKHKKFLADLKQQKQSLEQELEREEREKEEKRVRFRETLRKKREAIVKERRGDDCNAGGVIEEEEEEIVSNQRDFEEKSGGRCDAEEKECKTDEPEVVDEKQKKKKVAALKRKPKWALTEDNVEDLEDAEADELLSFAKSLDFEGFMNDLEVRSAIKAAKERVDTLKYSARSEEAQDEEGKQMETRSTESGLSELERMLEDRPAASRDSVRREWLERKKRLEEKSQEWNGKSSNAEDDSQSIARSILSDASVKSLKQIHSARSIAKIAEKMTNGQHSNLALNKIEEEDTFQPPRIVSIHEDERTRLTKKNETYNLPYMHRNPAI